ncbi:fumarylacetoacetate hydrolase family protein [Burkholderia sp. MSMB1835]|uniref:fumarylacetoacetate hydrolase family protein n=1 Tax=Burkholderia sp. MSMB1835 TaxID=1637876 RepID=UPI00076D5ED6|nr:fumarylacetoacetate hydrolase family protein [Burkholderia sp. MSMB1835]KVL37241.1 hypothetical protein WS96_10065 [Burkholderia sp. MSMB1835]
MGKSIVRFNENGNTVWGVLEKEQVFSLTENYPTTAKLVSQFSPEQVDRSAPRDYASLRLLSPIVGPSRLVCQGMNYATHREETQATAHSDHNLIFLKDVASLCGPQDDIIRPADCKLLDYEIELGLVMRRKISGPVTVTEANLGDYVAGLVLVNDVSARDLMFGASMLQWFRGKSQRNFCPAGPILYLIDRDEASAIHDLNLKLWLNGEIKQDANTAQLIHKPATTLTEISRFMDIDEGDVLLTGTPGGVLLQGSPEGAKLLASLLFDDAKRLASLKAHFNDGENFLQPGDRLRLEIKSTDGRIDLGSQQSTVVARAQESDLQGK